MLFGGYARVGSDSIDGNVVARPRSLPRKSLSPDLFVCLLHLCPPPNRRFSLYALFVGRAPHFLRKVDGIWRGSRWDSSGRPLC